MKNVLFYQGGLPAVSSVNGLSDPYYVANLINQHDRVMLLLPFTQGVDGSIIAPSSFDFLNVIRSAGKPIWVIIDLFPSAYIVDSNTAMITARNAMAYFYTLFLTNNISHLLGGFHFNHFGYGSVIYSDGTRLSRAQQNELVSICHVQYHLPISVTTPYIGDIFATTGTLGRAPNIDINQPLQTSAVGRNPVLRDQVVALNPLFADADGTPNFHLMADALATAKQLRGSGRNVDVVIAQSFDTSVTSDSVIGLTISAWGVKAVDRCQFLASLGFDLVAIGTQDFGRSTNQIVDPAAYRIGTGWQAEVYGELYSRGGNLYTETPVVVGGISKIRVRSFNNALALQSTTDVEEG